MSEPMRFSLKHHGQLSCVEHCPEGEYVLHSDYAKLKAEVESLKKPATIGGYNISEYIRMANSETLEFDNGDIFADMTLPERIKYIVESHARLKAEVERLIKERDKALTDFWYIHEGYFRLQAEVNRLTAFTTRTIIPNKELQAQVERLTKAGDAMISEWASGEEKDGRNFLKALLIWTAAKEGKQP